MKREPPTGPDIPQPPPVSAHAGANAAGRDVLNSVALHVENATMAPVEAYGPIPDDAADAGLSNVPRGALFVGRTAELDALEAAFAEPGGVVLRAVSGLGGVGKSALAARWAERCSTARLRWWISADSTAGVEAGLAGLARALQPGLTGLPQELQRERALAWLAAHDDWLLVLDNVNHPDDVRPLLDRLGAGGRVLVTTRLATGWHHLTTTTVRLGVFAPAESVEFFRRALTQDGPRDTGGVAEVCEEVGHLALAVEQAAAYCHENGTTPRAYLDMLRSWPAEMFATGAETTDADRTVARVWRITLDRLADTPLADEVLRTLAWYAPDHIPRTLLDGLAPPPVLARAIGRLVAHSMVAVAPDGTLSVHRLVQALARTPDPDDPHRGADAVAKAREEATRGLHAAVPDEEGPDTWPLCRTLLAHIEALAQHGPPEDDSLVTAFLLGRTAVFLAEQGTPEPAVDHYRRALRALDSLGKDDPAVWSMQNSLAGLLVALGQPGEAVALFERALAGSERDLGVDHLTSLTLRINVATATFKTGDLDRAESLFRRALADAIRTGGEEHPHTLAVRSGLAHLYEKRGDVRRALTTHRRVLADRRRILGEDHLDTLSARDSLAHAHEQAGSPARAVSMLRANLDAYLRLLGEAHPVTLGARGHLGETYMLAGDPARAAALYRQNLDAAPLLGRDHPQVLLARLQLAEAHRTAGDLGPAVSLYEEVVAERSRIYGEDSVDALRARDQLAGTWAEAGEHERAHTLYERNLAACERVLGNDHPETLTARHNLAQNLLVGGKAAAALPLHGRLATDRARVLGPHHPETLTSRAQLAVCHVVVGFPERGIVLLEQLLADCVRTLGAADSRTARVRRELADVTAVVRATTAVNAALGRSASRFVARPGPSRGTSR